MSDEGSKLTVPVLLGWNLSHLRDVVAVLRKIGPEIETEMDSAAGEIAKSDEYFIGEGGTKARGQGITDKKDGHTTVDLYQKLADKISPIVETFELEIANLKAAVVATAKSEWDLFYTDQGEVKSRKSNWETAKAHWWDPISAVARKELEILVIGTKFREALAKIRVTDASTNDIAGVLEDLSNTVKLALANVPTDKTLADILLNNQVDDQKMVVWPSGTILEAILIFDPSFKPTPMTVTEAAALAELFNIQGPTALKDFYDIKNQAADTAKELFPDSVNDGQGDAFRHTYWNALMSDRFGEGFAKTYATGHEGAPGQPSHREAMDLFNNNLGRTIAEENPGASADQLKDKVKEAIGQGRAIVIGTTEGSPDPHIGWSGGPNGIPEKDTGLAPGAFVPLPGR
ncbi:DUF6973 domain-containing protein [Nocardia tengchongensis]|uniref:DUF6973 domain-containing protein n=1 Tax=Nocardia tengchongensis TaxID=2055889 RepID=UPI00368E7BF0